MLLLIAMGCLTGEESYDSGSNLCGTIDAPMGAPEAREIAVLSVREGHSPCEDAGGDDTGGMGDTGDRWWADTVASPEPDGKQFEATVEPGTYGVEVIAGDNSEYVGCAAVDVADTSQCSGEVTVELVYEEPVDKPNLYLYPEEPTAVHVTIPGWKRLTESEPRYPVDGWRVTAEPDGLLRTNVGTRDYLFYELLVDPARFQTDAGWCVPGELAQASIEDAMADLGFLPNEVADFADAWDADFPRADVVTVYPQVDRLTALRIEPAPDVLLRAWFVVADGCHAVEAPELAPVERTGFHAAEWGIAFERPLSRDPVIVEGWR